MHRISPSRRVFALLAAYVVVLQALLLPLTVAAGADVDSALCVTAPAGEGSPASHDTGCGCAAGCGMHGGAQPMGAAPGSLETLLPAFTQVTAAVWPIKAVSRPFGKRPNNPRAPPAA